MHGNSDGGGTEALLETLGREAERQVEEENSAFQHIATKGAFICAIAGIVMGLIAEVAGPLDGGWPWWWVAPSLCAILAALLGVVTMLPTRGLSSFDACAAFDAYKDRDELDWRYSILREQEFHLSEMHRRIDWRNKALGLSVALVSTSVAIVGFALVATR